MTVTTNEHGQQNVFAKEPQVKVMDVTVTHNEKAEQLNGRLAMLGVSCGFGLLVMEILSHFSRLANLDEDIAYAAMSSVWRSESAIL